MIYVQLMQGFFLPSYKTKCNFISEIKNQAELISSPEEMYIAKMLIDLTKGRKHSKLKVPNNMAQCTHSKCEMSVLKSHVFRWEIVILI